VLTQGALLSLAQEKALLATCLAFDDTSQPLRPTDVISLAGGMLGLPANWDGSSFLRNFLARHRTELASRRGSIISLNRVSKKQDEPVRGFCRTLGDHFADNGYGGHMVFNLDESIFGIKNETLFHCRISNRERTVGHVAHYHGQCLGSVLVFASAEGDVFMVVFVLKANSVKSLGPNKLMYHGAAKDEKARTRRKPLIYYAFNQTGMMNQALFPLVLSKFKSHWEAIHPGLRCLLLLDRASPHLGMDALVIFEDTLLKLCFFPANCTHWLQPLDLGTFAFVKNRTRLALERGNMFITDLDKWKEMLIACYEEAFKEASFSEAVRHGWKESGLWPFDKAVILERMQRNIAGPHPAAHRDEVLELARNLCGRYIAAQQQSVSDAVSEVESVDLPVETNTMYFGSDLLSAKRSMLAEKEAAAAAKAAKRTTAAAKKADALAAKKKRQEDAAAAKARKEELKEAAHAASLICRICSTHFHSAAGPAWKECTKCNAYDVCGQCWRTKENRATLQTHEKFCTGFHMFGAPQNDGQPSDSLEDQE
jgi:hypothetical protein